MLYGVSTLLENLFEMNLVSKIESKEVDFYFQIGEKGMYGYDLIQEVMKTENDLIQELKNLGFEKTDFICEEYADEYTNYIYTVRIRNAVFANN